MSENKTTQRGYAAALILAAAGGTSCGRIGCAAGSAAWLCCLAGGAAGALFFLFVSRLAALHPESTFYGSLSAVFGRTLGRLISLAAALFSLRLCAHEVAATSIFMSAALLENTSTVLIAAALLLLCALAAAGGDSTVARWAELMMPPVLLMIVVVLALAAPDLDLGELRLRGVTPKLAFETAAGFFLSAFCGGLGCAVLLFRLKKNRGGRWQGAAAVLTAAVVLALIYIWNTALLGANVLDRFNFPTYHALRVIGLSSLEVRLEVLLMLPMVMMSFMRSSTLLLAALRGTEEALRLPSGGALPYLLAAATLAVVCGVYENQSAVDAAEGNIQLGTLLFYVLPVLLALAVGLIRRRLARG